MKAIYSAVVSGLLLIMLLWSCVTADTQSTVTDSALTAAVRDSTVSDSDRVADEEIRLKINQEPDELAGADTIVRLQFNELRVSIWPVSIDEVDRPVVSQSLQDSIAFGIDGYAADGGLRLLVSTDLLTDITVDERVRVVVTFSPAGHEEITGLIESTRSYSPWRPLRRNSRHEFISGPYRDTDLMRFTGLSLQAVRQVIKEHSGPTNQANAPDKRSLNDVTGAVVSELSEFRVIGRCKDTGKRVIKRIIIYNQLEC